ncbi:MAG: RsmE family RNA methyltransferase [Candidatus Gracilibacteria bacterium]|nr:RsmE family RNA methyltransferase [bacterium]MDZ4216693.1 RsmE family RNA methyltransferase [Candidatus Gracilibacteria bacterium]
MHRFFIDPHSLNNQHFRTTDKELCHQVSKVLKMSAGKKIIFCDNTEHEYLAEWTIVSRSECSANILEKNFKPDIGSLKPVHLFVPPLKNQNRWELMLEKGTEIGVASFTPLITARTEVTELRKLDRLQRIIIEAAEQSGRTKLPTINPPLSFQHAINNNCNIEDTIRFIATLDKDSKPLSSSKLQTPISELFIGPVGDFTAEEIQQALDHGFFAVSLGQQIMRTETAALVAATLCLN